IQYIAQFLPDSEKVREDLLKFAKAHDRRNYQLVRFIISPEYDFGTVHKAIKELTKRLQGPNIGVLDTLVPLLYRSGCFVFNRSHLSTIMDYSRTDKDGMGSTAHELLNEISQRNADLFKTHIGELCKDLIDKAPDEKTANDPAMVETLKACASFAESNPGEVPGNREFTSTLLNYALYGQPPTAAKYAVSILMAKRDDRSALSAADLLQRSLSKWDYGNKNFLNRLAAIGQLELLAPKVTQDADDEILDMAVQKILLSVRTDAKDSDPEWVEDAELDDECRAKCLCLKILVNRLRGDDAQEPNERSRATFKLLKSLVRKDGEICKVKDTPKYHRNRLRLLAAQSLLKLCKTKHLDEMLGPADFNNLAWVVQSSCPQVRRLFLERLQKYLMRG
ncbi:MAG: sister chromatid cohesion protein PDS5, partial [Thaumarchaeota archaeon]|nr:sister chromatid cohesion protein PDS5 [Nitrososphaerota archaeon]